MAGHMGDKIRTIQNLEIIKSDIENNLIFIKGSIPGSKNSIVLIKKNTKNLNRITTLDKYKKTQTEISKKVDKPKDKTASKEVKAEASKQVDKLKDKTPPKEIKKEVKK